MAAEPAAPASTADDSGQERRSPLSARAYLFVVLHCDNPAAGGARYGLEGLDEVTLGRGEARLHRRDPGGRRLVLRLPGSTVSSTHASLTRSGDGWVIEDHRSKNGTLVNGAKVTRAALRDGDLIEVGPAILSYRAALPGGDGGDLDTGELGATPPGFATLVPQIGEQLAALARMAQTEVTVLLLGESGSGKEVLARAVHALSGRAGAFVPVNCGGLPASLLESQLFGHLKGSFTGAMRDEPGYVRSADRGTLFLDEIGDLPLPAQAALLRVLQEREVVPVGATRPVKVDLRVVAATHRPLAQMASRGEFRSDLLARLSGYRHLLAPLRHRREDLGLLSGDLLRRADPAREIRLSPAVGRRLLAHAWPLNIRELQQCLAVAVVLAGGSVVELEHLPVLGTGALPEGASVAGAGAPASEHGDLRDPEALRRTLVTLLAKHEGKVSYVARDLGKARMQIHRWMARFGIDHHDYRRRAGEPP